MSTNPRDENWGPARYAAFANHFLKLGIEEGLALARKIGFRGFEMLVEDALKYERRMAAAYERGEFYVSSLVVVLNDFNLGKESSESILQKLREAVRLSAAWGRPGIILADYFPPPAPAALPGADVRRDWLADLLSEATDQAGKSNVFFLVERMVRKDSSTFPTIESCVEFIDRFESPAVRLLYDTYHFQHDGVAPLKVLRDYVEIIGHVHLSDSTRGGEPSRPYPGEGDVDFKPVVEFLDEVNLVPFWGFEGSPDTEQAMQRSVDHISSVRKHALPPLE